MDELAKGLPGRRVSLQRPRDASSVIHPNCQSQRKSLTPCCRACDNRGLSGVGPRIRRCLVEMPAALVHVNKVFPVGVLAHPYPIQKLPLKFRHARLEHLTIPKARAFARETKLLQPATYCWCTYTNASVGVRVLSQTIECLAWIPIDPAPKSLCHVSRYFERPSWLLIPRHPGVLWRHSPALDSLSRYPQK